MSFRDVFFVTLMTLLSCSLRGQSTPPTTNQNSADSIEERLKKVEDSVRYADEHLAKAIDDVMWMRRLEEIAEIDKVRFTGPPPRVTNNPTAQGAGNPLVISAYTFLP